MNSTLKPEHDFQVEAKRVTIANDIEKLTNNMLSDFNIDFAQMQCNVNKICQQNIPWKDNCFWNELPNPKSHTNHTTHNFQPCKPLDNLPPHLQINHNKIKDKNQAAKLDSNKLILLQKCFHNWHNYSKNKRNRTEQVKAQLVQREKLNKFLKSLKQYQSKKRLNDKAPIRCTLDDQNNAEETSNKLPEGCFKHRFKAQQQIIQSQKEKLVKQEKIIEGLKLGKLHEEITQSLQETQQEIQETLAKCSIKVKCKIKPIGLAAVQEEALQFHVKSTKAPKIVQIMEKRALERECRRQIIFERKAILDQLKKRAIQVEIERKRVQDEEERKRNLEAIKVARKKELELQQQIQLKKQRFLEQCAKADGLYKRKLSKYAFKGLITLLAMRRNNVHKSQQHYEMSLKRKGLESWIKLLEEIDNEKYRKVQELYNYKLKKKILRLWNNVRILGIQHLQVAEDLYDLKLQSRSFIHWHVYTCAQYIRQNKNLLIAQRHHHSRILHHYFYLWKSLPVVVQLEKAKEEKKRKWREKVWEILPDYRPITDD